MNNNITNISNSNIAVVRDIKASGIDGGTFNSGAWRSRDLNTLEGDTSFISIDSISTFTLDSGIYEITAFVPGRNVQEHQARLFNVTDNVQASIGSAVMSATASPNSVIMTVIKINAPTTFEIQHRCAGNQTNNGFGQAVSWGPNVYTQVRIQKL